MRMSGGTLSLFILFWLDQGRRERKGRLACGRERKERGRAGGKVRREGVTFLKSKQIGVILLFNVNTVGTDWHNGSRERWRSRVEMGRGENGV